MTKTTAIVLCGGDGRRIGGLDKPLVKVGGYLLIEHVLNRIEATVDQIILVANRNHDAYARYGVRVIDDGLFIGRGPLGGMAAGLMFAGCDQVLCVPGDAPDLPSDLKYRLELAMTTSSSQLGAMAHDLNGPQPLCSLMKRFLVTTLQQDLDWGIGSPIQWMRRHRFVEVAFSEWPLWGWSANTWDEIEAARLMFDGQAKP